MNALRIHNYNRAMDELSQSFCHHSSRNRGVALDIMEKEMEYTLVFDLPGINKENIDVSIKGKILTIEVKPEEKKEEQGKYHIQNRQIITFKRSFQLPENAEKESLSAAMENGVLTLTLEKKPETAPRSISIN